MTGHPCWALLNEEGRRLWGDIFPDGQIPIQGIQTGLTELEGRGPNQRVRLIALEALTPEQYDKVTRRITEKFRPPTLDPELNDSFLENVRQEIRNMGLPLRDNLVATIMLKDPQKWI